MEVSLKLKTGQKMDIFFFLQHATFPLNEENKIGDLVDTVILGMPYLWMHSDCNSTN